MAKKPNLGPPDPQSPHQPQPRSVQDMKDSKGKGSRQERPQAMRPKHGKPRSGTPQGGQSAPPEIGPKGEALQTSGKNKGQPKPLATTPRQYGGQDSDRPQVATRAATAGTASGPNDLEAARRIRSQVLSVMQRRPYRIPNRVAQQRIGSIDFDGGTSGTFDVGKAMSFLQAHEQHVRNNPRTNRYDPLTPMDHPWLRPPGQ